MIEHTHDRGRFHTYVLLPLTGPSTAADVQKAAGSRDTHVEQAQTFGNDFDMGGFRWRSPRERTSVALHQGMELCVNFGRGIPAKQGLDTYKVPF
jgi:hypothetical protein